MTRVFLEILVLLIAANGAPVITARCLGPRAAWPVDGGRTLPDGKPLFGSSKTWRGLIAVMATSAVLAAALGFGLTFGLVFGALVAAGDLLSSFVKRRRGLPPSSCATGLDQLPESLLPSIYAVIQLGLAWWWSVLWAAAFMVLEILLSRPLYHLHIRKRPY